MAGRRSETEERIIYAQQDSYLESLHETFERKLEEGIDPTKGLKLLIFHLPFIIFLVIYAHIGFIIEITIERTVRIVAQLSTLTPWATYIDRAQNYVCIISIFGSKGKRASLDTLKFWTELWRKRQAAQYFLVYTDKIDRYLSSVEPSEYNNGELPIPADLLPHNLFRPRVTDLDASNDEKSKSKQATAKASPSEPSTDKQPKDGDDPEGPQEAKTKSETSEPNSKSGTEEKLDEPVPLTEESETKSSRARLKRRERIQSLTKQKNSGSKTRKKGKSDKKNN